MLDVVDKIPGEWLGLNDYLEDFGDRFLEAGTLGVWKLERRQHFRQPESESWTAFSRGEWKEALNLLENNRSNLENEFRDISEAGFDVHRVRVAEEPITPYLQWELHSLHIRAQCGEKIRVISPQQITVLESENPLPEIVTLGKTVMYKLGYDDRGVLGGAERFMDPALVTPCREGIETLHEAGEDLESFFTQNVAGMAPPHER